MASKMSNSGMGGNSKKSLYNRA